MIETAGLFLISVDNNILVCHPTNHKADFWSIPKGQIDKGEERLAAAIRETKEEANVDASNWKLIHNLEPVKHAKKNKILYPFVLFERQNPIDFKSFELKCNSMVPEEIGGFPEMDAYKWVTIDEAREVMHESQVKCLDIIKELIKRIWK